jgi:XRE family transcriptional regulator of biofilm formation
MTFGERLREARMRSGFSQSDLTKRSGVPKTMLSRYENDHILPSITTLGKLAEALAIEAAALLGEEPIQAGTLSKNLDELGILIEDEATARRLASVIAKMVDDKDTRVSFLQKAESQSHPRLA